MGILVGKQVTGEFVVARDSHDRHGGRNGQLLSIRPVEGLDIAFF
jgi:hypothetical protein